VKVRRGFLASRRRLLRNFGDLLDVGVDFFAALDGWVAAVAISKIMSPTSSEVLISSRQLLACVVGSTPGSTCFVPAL